MFGNMVYKTLSSIEIESAHIGVSYTVGVDMFTPAGLGTDCDHSWGQTDQGW